MSVTIRRYRRGGWEVDIRVVAPHKRLDAIKSEDVQHLKSRLSTKAAKTVNNILTVLNLLLKKALDWEVIERMRCAVTLLPPKTSMSFSDFDEVRATRLGGERDRCNHVHHRAPERGGGAFGVAR